MVKLKLRSVLHAKARAATLLESLVAMVVVLLSFGIALMIYVNVANSNNSQQRLNAYFILNQVLAETVEYSAFANEEFKKGSLTIIRAVLPYGRSKSLIEIHLEARDLNGKILSVLNKIVSK